MNENLRAALPCVDRIERAEASPIDSPLVERYAANLGAREPRFELRDLVRGKPRVRLATLQRLIFVVRAKVGVEQLEHDAGRRTRRDGHQEWNAEQQERRDLLDVPRVAARIARDRRVLRQIANSAVNHPARIAARAEREVIALEECDLHAPEREISGDTRAVDSTADDDDVELTFRLARFDGLHRRRFGWLRKASRVSRRFSHDALSPLCRMRR